METVGWRRKERRRDELLRWSDKRREERKGERDVGRRSERVCLSVDSQPCLELCFL